MKYAIRTFGCQMNYSDSERVAQILEQSGFSAANIEAEADLLVVNTCSVRQKSEDKAYGFMVQTKKDQPDVKIAVTGCMVRQTGDKQTSRDTLLKHEPIDIVFRIEDTARVPKLLETQFPEHDFSGFADSFGNGSVENYFKIVPKVENKSQVFVPIMQGCDKFCTYCIVPYTRGREISRPMDEILEECAKLVQNGATEITLLGQNVNSYTDGGTASEERCFAKLLLEIDKLYDQGLSRLRFTSAHPQDFTDDVVEALAEMQTSCPYIHLPVQHGADTMLRKMNRNYTIDKYEAIIEKIRTAMPDTTLATDIIVGFPGETEEEFQQLCDFADRMKFCFSYTAIFSPRNNTPAARMESEFVPDEIKRERFHKFDTIIKKNALPLRENYVGKTVQVLVEKSEPTDDGMYQNTGRSREFFEVWFESGRPFYGKEVNVKITKTDNYVLVGELEAGGGKVSLKVV